MKQPKDKKRNFFKIAYFISIVIADFVGLGISVTVFPALLLSGNWAGTAGFSHSSLLILLGVLLGTYPLGQFFGAAVFGKLSDAFGRRPLLILTLAGNMIGFIIAALAITSQSFVLLFVGRLIAGIFAGNVAIAQAGMVDISDADSKSGNLALLNGALGMSWIIGPPLGGILSDPKHVAWFTFSTPFWVETAVFGAVLLCTLLFFKETIVEKKSAKGVANLGLGLVQIREAFETKEMRVCFGIWAVFVAGWWLFESYLPTYLLQTFHYSAEEIGKFLGFMGTTFTVTSLFVVKPLSKRITPKNMVRFFLGISGVSVLALALATNSLQLHLCIFGFVSSMGFALPGLVGTISDHGDSSRQGETLGMIASIQAFMTVVVMMGGGSLFAIHRSITVVTGGVLLLASWVMFQSYFTGAKAVPANLETLALAK